MCFELNKILLPKIKYIGYNFFLMEFSVQTNFSFIVSFNCTTVTKHPNITEKLVLVDFLCLPTFYLMKELYLLTH